MEPAIFAARWTYRLYSIIFAHIIGTDDTQLVGGMFGTVTNDDMLIAKGPKSVLELGQTSIVNSTSCVERFPTLFPTATDIGIFSIADIATKSSDSFYLFLNVVRKETQKSFIVMPTILH